jgi:cytochrome c556
MFRTMLAVTAIAVGITAVAAQSDPIAARKQHMKEVGSQTKTGGGMAKGEIPYDQTKAQGIFAAYVKAGEDLPNLFPETSKTGGDTAALPAIWTSMADFKAKAVKFVEDSKAALSASKDLDSFKASFSGVTKNCGDCHQTYRAKKN